MPTKFSAFDAAEYLDSKETIAAYLNEVMAEDDQDLLLSALADIARARGMAKVAEDSGLGRESLYKALKPGAKPGYATVDKVVRALGLRMAAVPVNRTIKTKAAAQLAKPAKSLTGSMASAIVKKPKASLKKTRLKARA
jgi:probable addiction module antidote protein